MSKLLFTFLLLVSLPVLAQTPEQTTDEKINAEIMKSADALRAAYVALDIDKAFKEIDQIEKLYPSSKPQKDNDLKYQIKFVRAQLYAVNGNDDEALRLLGELKKEKPEYVKAAVYDCAFASLQLKPEFIRITGNSLELYFALAKPIDDSIKKCLDTNRFDKVLKYLDVKDSLYATLAPNDREKVSNTRISDKYIKAATYSMQGSIDAAMRLLQEMKKNGLDYVIYETTVDTAYFKNLKHTKEYQTLTSSLKCNCKEVFDWVVTEFEKNDAGFDYTVEMKGKEAYEKLTAEKQAESKSITSTGECVQLVNKWLNFFRKSHIGFFPNFPTFTDTINTYDKFAVKRLSKNTMYVKIKSFMGNNSRQIISDMIKTNDYLLSNTPNLIIDLRGNGGGSDYAWDPLRKYIVSKPLHQFENMIRVSEENEKQFDQRGEKEIADFIRNNARKRFAGNDTLATVTNPEAVQKMPESIVILVDENTGSSAESFLIYAKQSCKVKVMGQKTYGAEEVGNMALIKSSNKQFMLFYGVTIRSQAKYTQLLDYGIQPDIFLRKDCDWIEEARKYLEYE